MTSSSPKRLDLATFRFIRPPSEVLEAFRTLRPPFGGLRYSDETFRPLQPANSVSVPTSSALVPIVAPRYLPSSVRVPVPSSSVLS